MACKGAEGESAQPPPSHFIDFMRTVKENVASARRGAQSSSQRLLIAFTYALGSTLSQVIGDPSTVATRQLEIFADSSRRGRSHGQDGWMFKSKKEKKTVAGLAAESLHFHSGYSQRCEKFTGFSPLYSVSSVPHDCRPVPKVFKESFSVFLCEMQLTDSFPNRNYKYCPTKTIHEHSTRSMTFFVFSHHLRLYGV